MNLRGSRTETRRGKPARPASAGVQPDAHRPRRCLARKPRSVCSTRRADCVELSQIRPPRRQRRGAARALGARIRWLTVAEAGAGSGRRKPLLPLPQGLPGAPRMLSFWPALPAGHRCGRPASETRPCRQSRAGRLELCGVGAPEARGCLASRCAPPRPRLARWLPITKCSRLCLPRQALGGAARADCGAQTRTASGSVLQTLHKPRRTGDAGAHACCVRTMRGVPCPRVPGITSGHAAPQPAREGSAGGRRAIGSAKCASLWPPLAPRRAAHPPAARRRPRRRRGTHRASGPPAPAAP